MRTNDRIEAVYNSKARFEDQARMVNRILRLPKSPDENIPEDVREFFEHFSRKDVDRALDRFPQDREALTRSLADLNCEVLLAEMWVQRLHRVIGLYQEYIEMIRDDFPETRRLLDILEGFSQSLKQAARWTSARTRPLRTPQTKKAVPFVESGLLLWVFNRVFASLA